MIVVDPRRTGTADHSSEWLPIQPGTDAAFLLGLCHVLFDEDLVTLGHLADKVNGFDEFRELVRDYPPEAVADWCRVPAETIRTIAREFAAAPRAALYGRIGLCNQEFGTLASWLVDVVNIITGHFDAEGGLMWGNPVASPLALAEQHRQDRRAHLRPLALSGARRARGAEPGAVFLPGRGDRRTRRGPD